MTHSRFLSIVDPLRDQMFRLAYSFLKNESEAKDVVQDILAKLWENRIALDAAENVNAWCIKIAKTTTLDKLKYNSYRKTSEINPTNLAIAATDITRETEMKDTVGAIAKIVGAMPEKSRLLIHFRDVEGLAYNEIAKIMELNLPEVKTGISRARQSIREKLIKMNAHGL